MEKMKLFGVAISACHDSYALRYNRLFNLGLELAKSGYEWRKAVPAFGDTRVDIWIWTLSK